EPIGPRALLDILIIAPCTGNTLGKLANGITDTSVTMAAKAHLRNGRPILIAVSTNDALGASSKNIGMLLNSKNIYFVPMKQDNPVSKPTSIVADFEQIIPAMREALEGRQIQPIYFA
ncbi:MAG: dipicolinate synthase subunit B, partial [Oscillospiraceae bacterium]|nr:dipicolinate synthase subunit B [Oscillospiraceae bacterium]